MKNRLTSMILILMFPIAMFLATFQTGVSADGKSFGVLGADVIEDQGGRRIRIREPFRRIISLYGAHTENLFSLGLDREIIGVTRHEVFPPQALQKPVFSYHDDPEKFLGARPDLVLIRPMIDRGYPQFVERLEKSGITVVSIQPTTVEDMYRYWHVLGMLTGQSAAAEDMARRFQIAVNEFLSLTKTVARKKKVYFESIHSKMKTFSRTSITIFALETAGGINIAPDARSSKGTNVAVYGKERILSHAGEIDVYLAQHGAMNKTTVGSIMEEPGFSVIRAVKNGDVHLVDEYIVSRPTPRVLQGIFTVGRILYPERYGEAARAVLKKADFGTISVDPDPFQ